VFDSGGGGESVANGVFVQLLGVPLRWIGLAMGGVVLGISGLFGGLDEVDDPTIQTIRIDEEMPGSPFNVTIHSVRVADEAPKVRHTKAGTRWIIVEATLANTDTETNLLADRIVRIKGVEGVKESPNDDDLKERPDSLQLLRDGGLAQQVQPGLPIRAAFFWEQDASARVPTAIDVIVIGMTKRQEAGDGQVWWFDDTPVAVLHASVNYTRNASPSPTAGRPAPSGTPSTRPSATPRPTTPSATPSRSR
jgi:hypothetical protein